MVTFAAISDIKVSRLCFLTDKDEYFLRSSPPSFNPTRLKVPAFRFPTKRLSILEPTNQSSGTSSYLVRRALQLWDLHLTNASQLHSIDGPSFIHTLHSASPAVKPYWDARAGFNMPCCPVRLKDYDASHQHVHDRYLAQGAGRVHVRLSCPVAVIAAAVKQITTHTNGLINIKFKEMAVLALRCGAAC